VLRLTSNLGQILFLAGVGAALWRANLAAGLSSSGVSGLVIASAGVGLSQAVGLFGRREDEVAPRTPEKMN